MAVLYDIKRGFLGLFRGGMSPYILILLAGLILSLFRSCLGSNSRQRQVPQIPQESKVQRTNELREQVPTTSLLYR